MIIALRVMMWYIFSLVQNVFRRSAQTWILYALKTTKSQVIKFLAVHVIVWLGMMEKPVNQFLVKTIFLLVRIMVKLQVFKIL